MAGVLRSTAYQRMPPFTAYDALNVWPIGPLEERRRLGSRRGLEKRFTSELGSGNPVRMLASVRAQDVPLWVDTFDPPAFDSLWSASAALGDLPTRVDYGWIRVVEAHAAGSTLDDGRNFGAIHTWTSTNFDTAKNYSVTLVPIVGKGGVTPAVTNQLRYRIWLRMDNTTPLPITNSVMVEFDVTEYLLLPYPPTNREYTVTARAFSYVSGVKTSLGSATAYAANSSPPDLPLCQAEVNASDDQLNVYFNGTAVISAVDISSYTAGDKWGFGLNPTSDAADPTLYDASLAEVRFAYNPYESLANVERIVASSNGTTYVSTSSDSFTAVAGNFTVDSEYEVRAVEHSEIVNIADARTLVEGTDGVINGGGAGVLTSASVADWTAYVTDHVSNYYCEVDAGIYPVTSAVGANLTLTGPPADDASTIFRLFRTPKRLTLSGSTWTMTDWYDDSSDTMPMGCTLITRFLGSIVLAGQPWAPHLAYHSAQNNPLDWDTTSVAATGSYALSGTFIGVIGQPIRALIAWKDDYLIYAGEREMWLQRGHGRTGGTLTNLSHTIGIVGPSAWCFLPDGTLFWLSYDGLYAIPPGAMGDPKPMSRNRLPRELLNIGEDQHVTMGYDLYHRGVVICVTDPQARLKHWFYSMVYDENGQMNGGFWPVRFHTDHEPLSMFRDGGRVYFGCRDGHVRQFSTGLVKDDGKGFETYVRLGPVRIANRDHIVGVLNRLDARLAQGTDAVFWNAYGALTSEEAVTDALAKVLTTRGGDTLLTRDSLELTTRGARREFGTWSAGKNYANRMRIRGSALSLLVSGLDAPTLGWAIEGITMTATPLTVARKG
jgi:hypothetical protein